MKPTRWISRSIGVIAILASVAGSAAAQVAPIATNAFPARPITLIVPFPAGGPSDALARAVAQGMSSHLNSRSWSKTSPEPAGRSAWPGSSRPRPTATRSDSGQSVRTSPMPRCTRSCLMTRSRTSMPWGLPAPRRRYWWRGRGCRRPICRNSSRTRAPTARRHYGSAGVGSISHFACVSLLSALKQNITHVPYRGVAPAMNDLMGGHIDVMCDQSTTALAQVAGGKIRALAVLTDRRLPAAAGGRNRGKLRVWRREHPRMERLIRSQGHACADHQAPQRRASPGRCRSRLETADGGGGGRSPRARSADPRQGIGADRGRTGA